MLYGPERLHATPLQSSLLAGPTAGEVYRTPELEGESVC